MKKSLWFVRALAVILAVSTGLNPSDEVSACGGFLCQNSPVDQNAERIIFTQKKDGTISAYIQIQYTGAAEDFSWILPIPHPIGPEDIEDPDDAMAAFTELEVATDPVFIPPPMPQCAIDQTRVMAMAPIAESGAVPTFASGEVGPYGFDVIGSDDPNALINWLREHNYQVTSDMEPLIDVYVDEGFVFLAMHLLPDESAQAVQPVKLTYPSEQPMIPLRLTALASRARAVLRLDAENSDTFAYLAASEPDTGSSEPAQSRPAPRPVSALVTDQPTSFANDRYQVRRFLGEGGKKKVYLAQDTLLDREVAFTLIKTEGLDEVSRTRITREAQAMGLWVLIPTLSRCLTWETRRDSPTWSTAA